MNLWSLLNIWAESDKVKIFCHSSGQYVYEGDVGEICESTELSRYFNSVVTSAEMCDESILVCIAY